MNIPMIRFLGVWVMLFAAPLGWAQDHVHTPAVEDNAHQHDAPVHEHGSVDAEQGSTAHDAGAAHEQMSHEHAMHEEPVDEDPAHAQHMPVQERVQSGGGHEGHDMSMPEPSALRDPHAYSGGFVRHSGLYALEMDAPMEMSDIKHFAGLRVDRLETVNDGGAALEGWAWMGDSYNRLRMKGKAVMVDDRLDEGTLDLVASHAVSPFWDVYAGVGMLSHEDVSHHHALLGLKGLAPYWFEIDASLMVDQRGRVGLRLEADYEWLLTQRWILQPRLDLAAYSRSDRSLSRGEGLSEVLTGVRLRYEFSRRFAPYVGVERVHWLGQSADLLSADRRTQDTRWVAGLRFWF